MRQFGSITFLGSDLERPLDKIRMILEALLVERRPISFSNELRNDLGLLSGTQRA